MPSTTRLVFNLLSLRERSQTKIISLGICKHVLAVVSWVYHKSSEPSVTEVSCYWKKSPLAELDMMLHPTMMTPSGVQYELNSLYKSGSGEFLQMVSEKLMELKIPSMLLSQISNTNHPLCIHNLLHQYCTSRDILDKSYHNFKIFVASALQSIDKETMRLTNIDTREQSLSALWKILKFGRVSASILGAVAGCKKDTSIDRMVDKIFGTEKLKTTDAMLRGLQIENEVRREFCRDQKRRVQLGHFAMSAILPLCGASPDGIGRRHANQEGHVADDAPNEALQQKKGIFANS
jgi:YqaJ-like viral recombinase domain